MKHPILPYLNFDGNAREAMTFYAKCFNAEMFTQTFAEAKMDVPESAKNRLMHAKLTKNNFHLMASDTMPGMPFQVGTNVHLTLNPETIEEAEKLYHALGEKGTTTMPLQETFWALRFGMLTDKYGIHWMFNLDKPHGK